MDIKESKEALVAVNELSVFLISALKDGVQVKEDVSAIIAKLSNDAEFKEKLGAAFEGIKLVPAELKDLSIAEGIELITVQGAYVPKIWEVLKK